MKRIILAILIITALNVRAQSPRLCLYEEFTGETCGPCAITNPGLNTLLASPFNTSKVVAIKWQVPIPSAPTATWSLYQTNKNDIDWRHLGWDGSYSSTLVAAPNATAYGYPTQWVSSAIPTSGVELAPTGLLDGQHQWAFGAPDDHPGSLTTAIISAAQSNTAAFSVTMNRAWDATYSSVNLTVNIVATANYTCAGPLVFRTVMVEKAIHFDTPPGFTTEKDFSDVAIAAFPNLKTGVSMVPTWTVGQTQTFTLNCPIPSYTRDKAQIAFVGFIQDDATRKVAQAVRSNPVQLPNDAKALNAVTWLMDCSTAFTPTFEFGNNGNNAITAVTITPYLDGAVLPVITWSGNLAINASVSVVGNSITPSTSGGHTLSYLITGVSGIDYNPVNNSVSTGFYLATSYQGTPVTESFAGSGFPPAQWLITNTDKGPSWSRNSSANGISSSSGTGAAKYDFYSNFEANDADDLILPPIDLSGNSTPTLAFDVAYAQFSNENDGLDVEVSDNCGTTWNNVYSKAGSTLATSSPQLNPFEPTSASQWRREIVPLPGYNVNYLIVKFVARAQIGNNLYIDNVNLAKSNQNLAGVNQVSNLDVSVELFPNPARKECQLSITSLNNGSASIRVFNLLGQLVLQKLTDISIGNNQVVMDVNDLAAGVYNLIIDTKNTTLTRKLTVEK